MLLGAGDANGDIVIEAEDERAIGDLDEPRPAGGNVRRLLMYDLQLQALGGVDRQLEDLVGRAIDLDRLDVRIGDELLARER